MLKTMHKPDSNPEKSTAMALTPSADTRHEDRDQMDDNDIALPTHVAGSESLNRLIDQAP